MRLYFMLVRRVPPVSSPVLVEVFDLLAHRGFQVEEGIAEEMVDRADDLRVAHDLYLLKSHTELSLSLAGVLHSQGGRLLNPYPSCFAAQNKIIASSRLKASGVPVPRTWVTGDLELLQPIAQEMPLIVKPYLGHRGAGIHVVRHPDDLNKIPTPDGPVVVQEYVGSGSEDVKLYVVGDEVFGVRKPFSPDSFALPGRPFAVGPELREIALRCGEAFGLGLYGLDAIETTDGPFVVDVNYFPGYKGVPGTAAHIASYIERYARGRLTLDLPPLPAATSAGRTRTPSASPSGLTEIGA